LNGALSGATGDATSVDPSVEVNDATSTMSVELSIASPTSLGERASR
jgi:hypothetical protein